MVPAVEKHDARREELAASALQTLGERGYARTSLREIAQNSPFSHGVVHYYFKDKTDLIIYCVRAYKETCVTRYDDILAESPDAETLRTAFAERLAQTLVEDRATHRLWYDLRSQSLFEDHLRDDVEQIDDTLEQMIWRVVSRYAELADRELAVDGPTAYSLFDGIFEQALLDLSAGRDSAPTDLAARAVAVMGLLLR